MICAKFDKAPDKDDINQAYVFGSTQSKDEDAIWALHEVSDDDDDEENFSESGESE